MERRTAGGVHRSTLGWQPVYAGSGDNLAVMSVGFRAFVVLFGQNEAIEVA